MRGSAGTSSDETVDVPRRAPTDPFGLEVRAVETGADVDADLIDVGGTPRAPWSPQRRRLLTGAAAAVVAAGVVTGVVVHARTPSAPPAAASAPAPAAGSPSVPSLTEVDGRTALVVPAVSGGAPGSAPTVVALAPAPAAVAALTDRFPTLRGVEGGQVAEAGHYGVYLTGAFTDPAGSDVALTVYTARAPGTTPEADSYVSRTRFDRSYTVRTEVTLFTGTGWWVKITTIAPDPGPVADAGTLISDLTAVAGDARLQT